MVPRTPWCRTAIQPEALAFETSLPHGEIQKYLLVIKRGNLKSYKCSFNGNIIYEWVVFYCHVSLPESIPIILLAPAEKWKCQWQTLKKAVKGFEPLIWTPSSKEVAMQKRKCNLLADHTLW